MRCGLALLELGKTARRRSRVAAHGHAGFNVRVGVHTGGVLLGGGVDADGSIRGIAVNIAARMEQTAPAGALRISHDTYAQVRGLFDVEAQEPLAVKGVDQPIVRATWCTRAKPRTFRIGTRGIEGVATQMIGRDAELETLQAAFKRLFAERQLARRRPSSPMPASARAGCLYEFEAWSEAAARELLSSSAAAPRRRPGPALRPAARHPRLAAADRRRRQPRGRAPEDGGRASMPLFLHDDGPDLAEGHAHLLGHLIGIDWRDSRHVRGILDDPKQIRNRALPRRGAAVPPRRAQADGTPGRPAARRPALGRRREPGLPELSGRGEPRRAAAAAVPHSADAVRAAHATGAARKAATSASTCAARTRTAAGCWPASCSRSCPKFPPRCANSSPSAPKATPSTWKSWCRC